MKSPFVPLQSSSLPKASAGTFVPKVLPEPSGSTSSPGAAPHSSSADHKAHHGEPKVELKREGDQVTAITIQCSCGEVITLQCVY